MAKAARKRATRSGWTPARIRRTKPAKAISSDMLSPHDQTARMSIWRNVLSQVLRDLGDRSPVIVAQAWRWVRSSRYERDRREVCELAQIPYDEFMRLAISYGEKKMSRDEYEKDFSVSEIANNLYWPKPNPTLLDNRDENFVFNQKQTKKRRRFDDAPYTKRAKYSPRYEKIHADDNYLDVVDRYRRWS